MIARTTCLLLTGVLATGAAGQHAPPQESQTKPFVTGTTAVVVDVVVRDRKGTPVTELRKADFVLLEDGVRQEITDVTLVAPPSSGAGNATADRAASPPAAGAPDARPAVSTPTFVAFVFDRLSDEGRALAHKGALAYLDTFHQDDFAGVFLSDQSLVMLQTYTNDRARLRRALDEASKRALSRFDRASTSAIGPGAHGDADASVPVTAGAESEGRPVDTRQAAGPIPTAMSQAMFNTWGALSRERQGYATTNALLALTGALGMLPGRKTVVFFAEGLSIPDGVLPHFRNVVTTANRANVSIYTVDAAGLRVHSSQSATGREVLAMGGAGITLGQDGSNLSGLAMLMRNEEMLRSDPRTSLKVLADETGGFLVENTNDLARAFGTIDADRRFHYLLSYTPKRTEFRGEWRQVTVTVPGWPVSIRARSGYLAVRAPGAIPLLAYEGPAIAALERAPAPAEIAVRAAALAFPGSPEPRVAVLAAARGADLAFTRDDTAGTFSTDFTILARIRNAAGEVVRKASQPYRLSGPVAQLEASQRGDVLFFRQPTLAPGEYKLEVAVHDALARRAGVHGRHFTVPPRGGLEVSSLVVVQRGERVPAAEQAADNPLYVGDVLLYPNIGEPLRKNNALTLFFIVAGTASPAQATLEVVRGSRSLATLPVALDQPGADGRVRQLVQLPTSALPTGAYTLRLVVARGADRDVREAAITLIE